MKSFRPRFVALASGPIHGSRDEIIGWTPWHVEATAETMAWLTVQLDRLPDYYNDLQWQIVDQEPERDVANWGPRLPHGCDDASWIRRNDFTNDLPF